MKTKIVCYCGSLRFENQFKEMELLSLRKGEIALLPACMFVDLERKKMDHYKELADELHKRKIDLCDEVFVIDPGGYIGASTKSEIEYARSIKKPIKYYSTQEIHLNQ